MTRLLSLLALPLLACSPTEVDLGEDSPGPGSDGADGEDGGDGGDGGDDTPPDLDRLYPKDRVIEISLELPAEDWDALRFETRSMFDILAGDCMDEPTEPPFNWYIARATIDGEVVEDVGIRKKGLLGSLSTTRPGLKLDFDREVEGRRFLGLERMSLTGSPQDPTMLRTCLAYEHYAAAGVPAPRCGFAHVTVNGDDLGIYANVEAIDDHFVERLTGSAEVPLYEGTLSDLREGWTGTFDLDSDAADPALLEPLVEAVESGDIDAIGHLIDLDAYVREWVAEVMVGQWDGYAWNTNNFYLYLDPRDGRARFLPWGPDAAWTSEYPGGGLDWVGLAAALPHALVRAEGGEALYRAELERQLTTVWDEGAMLARIDEMEAMVLPYRGAQDDALNWLKYLVGRQDDVAAAGLAASWPEPGSTLRDPFCMEQIGQLHVEFEGSWDSAWGLAPAGTCTSSLEWYGDTLALPAGSTAFGADGGQALWYCYMDLSTAYLLPHWNIPESSFEAGSITTDSTVNHGVLYYADASTGWGWVDIAWMEGTIRLDEVGITTGATIRGSYDAALWSPAW